MTRHPVAQLLAAGCVLLAAVTAVTSLLVARAAEREALAYARGVTGVLAHDVAEPALPRGLAAGGAGAVDRFDRAVGQRLTTGLGNGDVRRIKLWSATGRVVYSDATALIGERFTLGSEEREVLADGGTVAEVSDLSKPENRFERDQAGLVEVYTRIRSPEGEPILFEAYFSDQVIQRRKQAVFAPFARIAVGGLVALLALAVPLTWVLARRLTRAAEDRERLIRRSMDASQSERRRIARDLHDGVVQDLAGSAFAVAAAARDGQASSATRQALDDVAVSLRASLRALRSLLVEIHPPDLGARGLPAALADLTAPAAAAGLATSVTVEGVDRVPDAATALVWRAAQEAVRNTLRHAGAHRLDIEVRGSDRAVVLSVVDDGRGFDPRADGRSDSFGLRGLRSLVTDAGGTLEVDSEPGRGTAVRVTLSWPEGSDRA